MACLYSYMTCYFGICWDFFFFSSCFDCSSAFSLAVSH